jgi:hypothetical protein
MKIAFLSELPFSGKVPPKNNNMRTEFAWMHALNADHFFLEHWKQISGYDYVMVIFPKGGVFLNSEGKTLTNDKNIVAIVTYSTDNEEEHNTNSENNLFIINDESSEKPYFLKKSEIKSIKRITGFYRNDKPFNLSKIA